MHLDVGRHHFPVAFVKRYIDILAAYKFNTFHWHLTEDQGWRIEIRKYPRLTAVGGCRAETMLEKNFDPYVGDGVPYCAYYTQDEIREVVEYARARYVTVIPEIEMPGHSVAALAAYPELACTEGPFEVATVWGVKQDIYCPSEETFAFLEDVLTEVMELFPSRYIHIGGDEAPKARWEESELAQEVMRREGLADEHELQSYFIRRIERLLLASGRRLIGWDEILDGGLAPEATVMSWRGMDGGIEAARQGHDVIMTPTSHVYFDYYQGDPRFEPLAIGGLTTLEKVYGFEPVPEELTAEEARHVLGAQANLWTEYIKTPQYAEYMALPRMLALAEVVWSPKDARDWDSFAGRLPVELRRLDELGVNYRIPHVRGLESDRLTLDDAVTVALHSLVPGARIHYTTDGTDPDGASPLYAGPIILPVDERGVTVTARAVLSAGRASAPRAATFARTSLRPADGLDSETLASGLRFAYYEAGVRSVDSLAVHPPARDGVAETIGLLGTERDEEFGYAFTGYLRVPSDAVYAFTLFSDDGSKLLIGDEVVIDHDGLHGPTERRGMIALEAGYHPITVKFFQAGGGKALGLLMQADGDGSPAPNADWLFHRR
jgi:hexosaminidase